jgi:two-component system, chemotaxis family, sensor kinase CheA
VVLVATDRTQELEATLLAKREAASAQRVLRITKNRDQFKTFVHGAGKIFDQVSKLLSRPKVDQPVIESVFQGIHTLKGDSGTFMLDFTFEKAHAFESKIQDLKTATDTARKESSPELLKEIEEMKTEFNKFIGDNREIIGDISEGSKALEIPFKDLSQFFERLEKNPEYKELAGTFQNQFLKEPIQKFFGHYNDLAADVAARRDKKIKPISFKDGDFRVSGEVYSELFSTFVHAIRNSIDHGIESPDDRTDIGKIPEGQVTIEFAKSADGKGKWLNVIFKDDGKGIDPKIIREKLQKNGVDTSAETDEQVIQHIFDSGFSTRDVANELSGRGVGMGAIKAAAEALGGSAFISSQVGKGATLKVSVPEFDNASLKEAISHAA